MRRARTERSGTLRRCSFASRVRLPADASVHVSVSCCVQRKCPNVSVSRLRKRFQYRDPNIASNAGEIRGDHRGTTARCRFRQRQVTCLVPRSGRSHFLAIIDAIIVMHSSIQGNARGMLTEKLARPSRASLLRNRDRMAVGSKCE